MKRSLFFTWCLVSLLVIFACEKKEQQISSQSDETPMADTQDETPMADTQDETPMADTQDETPMADSGEQKIFRIAARMPASLDPSKASGIPFHTLYVGIFQGLLISDPRTAAAVPGLVESWEVSEDGKTYTFLLKENLKWSDGVDLTAADFVYSWLRILNPETGSNYAWFPASVIKGGQDYLDGKVGAEEVALQALDERRFQVEFVNALPYLVEMLTHYSFGAVPRHVVEEYGDEWVKPENYVSSGPYRMRDWRQREYIELEPNPYFYDQSQVTLDKVIFIIVEDANTGYSMYQSNEVDWLIEIPSELIGSVKGNPDVFLAPYLGVYYFNFNTQKPPFDDLRVRRAFSLAVDKESLTRDVLNTGVTPTNSMVPPMEGYGETRSYRPEDLQKNIETAKSLLAEAGYPNGEGLGVLQAYYNTNEQHKKVSEFLQEQWRTNLGVEIELSNMEWKTFLELRRSHDFDIARNGWIGDYRDPSTFLDLFVSHGALNDSDYQSAEYDALLEKARSSSGEERLDYLRQTEERLLDDYSVMPLYFYRSANMIDLEKWDGWYPNIMNRHYLINIKPKQ